MPISGLNTLDTKHSNFKELFEQINQNFDKIADYINVFGDKIIFEEAMQGTSRTVTLENTYAPGKHNLLVFYNGAPQWCPDHYTEIDAHTIRLNFDRSFYDEIRVVIIRSNLVELDEEGYLSKLSDLAESSKEALSEAQSALNQAMLLRDSLTEMMNNLTIIQSDISSKYEEIKEMYDALKSSE